jgi:hypothetical protein
LAALLHLQVAIECAKYKVNLTKIFSWFSYK